MAKRPRETKVLGATVRALRLERGLSQEELAFRAGLHRTYVTGIEGGHRNLGWKNVVKVCRGLDVSLGQFVGRLESIDPLV